MRLIDPGCGEITDRLTILNLKILFGDQAGKDTNHFKGERTALLSKIRARELNGPWFDKVLELAAVNAALWHAEDDLRALRQTAARWDKPDSTGLTGAEDLKRLATETMSLAFQIQELNDQRGALVLEINKAVGDGIAKEKL